MIREFEIVADLYSPPDKRGNVKIVKKNILIKRQFDMYDVLLGEHTDAKGKVLKKYTTLLDTKNNQTYKINMPYEKAKQYKLGLVIEGYKRYN